MAATYPGPSHYASSILPAWQVGTEPIQRAAPAAQRGWCSAPLEAFEARSYVTVSVLDVLSRAAGVPVPGGGVRKAD